MKQSSAEAKAAKSTTAGQIAKSSKPTELKYLTLDKQQTLSQFGTGEQRRKKSQQAGGQPSGEGDYRAFSRPPGSGAAFQGAFGTQDYLPHLPDGDLTLLNTKASTYAVFVRRVALRVFQALKQSGWESLTAHEIQQIATNVFIQAKLSRDGKLLSVSVQSSSGSRNYDESVKKAVARAAADPHPPAGAEAADGTITFIFASRTWARMQVNPRTKAPFEQRWIFLGTGLE
jgi:TonB family protein